jgi:c-di-GMP-binding flagellar brake protein YcgR
MEVIMDERRRAKRMPITLSLEIFHLYKQDNVQVSNLHAPIEVVNISKSGIGFLSESVLPVGYYFNANVNLGNSEDTLHCVVQIIRSQATENGKTLYGCEFVGMASILSYLFEEYEGTMKEEDHV